MEKKFSRLSTLLQEKEDTMQPSKMSEFEKCIKKVSEQKKHVKNLSNGLILRHYIGEDKITIEEASSLVEKFNNHFEELTQDLLIKFVNKVNLKDKSIKSKLKYLYNEYNYKKNGKKEKFSFAQNIMDTGAHSIFSTIDQAIKIKIMMKNIYQKDNTSTTSVNVLKMGDFTRFVGYPTKEDCILFFIISIIRSLSSSKMEEINPTGMVFLDAMSSDMHKLILMCCYEGPMQTLNQNEEEALVHHLITKGELRNEQLMKFFLRDELLHKNLHENFKQTVKRELTDKYSLDIELDALINLFTLGSINHESLMQAKQKQILDECLKQLSTCAIEDTVGKVLKSSLEKSVGDFFSNNKELSKCDLDKIKNITSDFISQLANELIKSVIKLNENAAQINKRQQKLIDDMFGTIINSSILEKNDFTVDVNNFILQFCSANFNLFSLHELINTNTPLNTHQVDNLECLEYENFINKAEIDSIKNNFKEKFKKITNTSLEDKKIFESLYQIIRHALPDKHSVVNKASALTSTTAETVNNMRKSLT